MPSQDANKKKGLALIERLQLDDGAMRRYFQGWHHQRRRMRFSLLSRGTSKLRQWQISAAQHGGMLFSSRRRNRRRRMNGRGHQRRQGLQVDFNPGSLLQEVAELGFGFGHGRVATGAFLRFGFRRIVVVGVVVVGMRLHQA